MKNLKIDIIGNDNNVAATFQLIKDGNLRPFPEFMGSPYLKADKKEVDACFDRIGGFHLDDTATGGAFTCDSLEVFITGQLADYPTDLRRACIEGDIFAMCDLAECEHFYFDEGAGRLTITHRGEEFVYSYELWRVSDERGSGYHYNIETPNNDFTKYLESYIETQIIPHL